MRQLLSGVFPPRRVRRVLLLCHRHVPPRPFALPSLCPDFIEPYMDRIPRRLEVVLRLGSGFAGVDAKEDRDVFVLSVTVQAAAQLEFIQGAHLLRALQGFSGYPLQPCQEEGPPLYVSGCPS